MFEFRAPPGCQLMGPDAKKFSELARSFEVCTNPMLFRPDWQANMSCSDLVNALSSRQMAVLKEFVYLIRRRLSSAREPMLLILILSLVDLLIKNCSTPWYSAINEDEFMNELGKVARKYSPLTGTDNAAVTELVTDIIQSVGEVFLPQKDKYPCLVKIYHQLRKEGIVFKKQYDPSRVPIITPMAGSGDSGEKTAADVLSHTIESSHQIGGVGERGGSRNTNGFNSTSAAPSSSSSSSSGGLGGTAEALSNSMGLLKEVIIASTRESELLDNDIAKELIESLASLQGQLVNSIEEMLQRYPERIEGVFALNDEATTLMEVFTKIRAKSMTLTQAKALVNKPKNFSEPPEQNEVPKKKSTVASADFEPQDLLDLGDSFPDLSISNTAAKPAAALDVGSAGGGGQVQPTRGLVAPISATAGSNGSSDSFFGGDSSVPMVHVKSAETVKPKAAFKPIPLLKPPPQSGTGQRRSIPGPPSAAAAAPPPKPPADDLLSFLNDPLPPQPQTQTASGYGGVPAQTGIVGVVGGGAQQHTTAQDAAKATDPSNPFDIFF